MLISFGGSRQFSKCLNADDAKLNVQILTFASLTAENTNGQRESGAEVTELQSQRLLQQ